MYKRFKTGNDLCVHCQLILLGLQDGRISISE